MASQKKDQSQHTSANTAENTTPRHTPEVPKGLSSALIHPELTNISNEEWYSIFEEKKNHCWICDIEHTNGTAFCQKHFDQWANQWNISDPEKIGLDIPQFSYAHRDYRGPRLPGHGSRALVRNWLAC